MQSKCNSNGKFTEYKRSENLFDFKRILKSFTVNISKNLISISRLKPVQPCTRTPCLRNNIMDIKLLTIPLMYQLHGFFHSNQRKQIIKLLLYTGCFQERQTNDTCLLKTESIRFFFLAVTTLFFYQQTKKRSKDMKN